MNHQPLPQAWRSEAFAEDLSTSEDAAPRRWQRPLGAVLLLVPVMLATAGAAVAAWVHI